MIILSYEELETKRHVRKKKTTKTVISVLISLAAV